MLKRCHEELSGSALSHPSNRVTRAARRYRLRHLTSTACLLAVALPTFRAVAESPYPIRQSVLAQHYYRQCRAEQRLRDQLAKDLNEKGLPMPPTTSFRESLTPAERHDAELVCLGATLQRFDDMEEYWRQGDAAAAKAESTSPAPPAEPPVGSKPK